MTSSTLALLLSVAPVAHGQTSKANDEPAIYLARVTQTRALAANDLDCVVSFWTPGITIRRALGQPLFGMAESRKVLELAAP